MVTMTPWCSAEAFALVDGGAGDHLSGLSFVI